MEDKETINELVDKVRILEQQVEQCQLQIIKLNNLKKELMTKITNDIENYSNEINKIYMSINYDVKEELRKIGFNS